MTGAAGGRAVFLDRDGVLNRTVLRDGRPEPPWSLDELEIIPDVPAALARLKAAGFRLVMVTNQPDVSRGRQTRAGVEAVNAALQARLPLDEIRVCYHDDAQACACRKPAPGMLLDAARDAGLDLAACFMIGDRWRDVAAGQRAGCPSLFIDYGYAEPRPAGPYTTVRSLTEAVNHILGEALTMTGQPNLRVSAGNGHAPQPAGDAPDLSRLRVKIFADGADRAGMLEMYARPYIAGFTTNPTLMRRAGVSDYAAFAHDILAAIPDRPISFEVFSDDLAAMERQARLIAGWGDNVVVKIPITNTRGDATTEVVRRLSQDGVKLNVTALFTLEQVRATAETVRGGAPCLVSVFAGRVADTGRDPVPHMATALDLLRAAPNAELVWASPRELFNIFQADAIGCHIITVTNDVLKKLAGVGKDLDTFSLETVQMFHADARRAGYEL
jgi:transaldolase